MTMPEFQVPYGTTRDRWVWFLEVGERVAFATQYLPRDMRWWRGLWR